MVGVENSNVVDWGSLAGWGGGTAGKKVKGPHCKGFFRLARSHSDRIDRGGAFRGGCRGREGGLVKSGWDWKGEI